MTKRKYLIEYDRGNCIGAAACAAVAPEFWSMDEDNKANLAEASKNTDNSLQTREVELDESELNNLLESAKTCPVNVIHVIDKETGEKLI